MFSQNIFNYDSIRTLSKPENFMFRTNMLWDFICNNSTAAGNIQESRESHEVLLKNKHRYSLELCFPGFFCSWLLDSEESSSQQLEKVSAK